MARRISEKQLDANRRNAQRSTGPKTEAGKAKSRLNSTVHGLTAEVTIITRPVRNEDPEHFAQLRAAFIADFDPQTMPELAEVEKLASAYKRIQRAEAIESAYMDGALEALQHRFNLPCQPDGDNDNFGIGILFGKDEHDMNWNRIERYRRAAWLDYNRALEALRKLQKDRTQREKEAAQTAASPAASTKMGSFRKLVPGTQPSGPELDTTPEIGPDSTPPAPPKAPDNPEAEPIAA